MIFCAFKGFLYPVKFRLTLWTSNVVSMATKHFTYPVPYTSLWHFAYKKKIKFMTSLQTTCYETKFHIIILPDMISSSRFRNSSIRRRIAWCDHLKAESCSALRCSEATSGLTVVEIVRPELDVAPLLFFKSSNTLEA